MADTITSSKELNIGLDYITGDGKPGSEGTAVRTVYLKVPNPKANLTAAQIRQQTETFINAQIIKDIEGNPFSTSSIATAFTIDQTKIKIDIDG